MAARQERRNQPPTHVAGRARNKDVAWNKPNSTLGGMNRRPPRLVTGLVVAAGVCAAVTAEAQRRRGGFGGRGGFGFGATMASPKDFDGLFHFCRIVFRNA